MDHNGHLQQRMVEEIGTRLELHRRRPRNGPGTDDFDRFTPPIDQRRNYHLRNRTSSLFISRFISCFCVSFQTAEEYQDEYNSRRGHEYSRFHGYTYDGIWAVALAIQNVAHKIRYYRRNQTVSDFRYRDPLWERLFLDALHNTSFEGMSPAKKTKQNRVFTRFLWRWRPEK